MKFLSILIFSLLLCFPQFSSGQKQGKKITISGKVTDANNKPVPGAAIFIDKVKTDQLTDAEGFYKVKIKSGASEILVFTLLNGAKEELINGRTEINIVLTGMSAGIPENINEEANKPQKPEKVQSDKKNTSRTPGTIDVKSTKIAVYQDIYDMIRGRAAGVEVSGKSIRIRGVNSLNVSTEPLFVVDGVIVSTIDDISPETVKSIEVLKGPDATAYGTRGSNGVILITRKKSIEE